MKTPRFELKDFRLNEILSMLTPYSGPSLSEELNRVWTGEARTIKFGNRFSVDLTSEDVKENPEFRPNEWNPTKSWNIPKNVDLMFSIQEKESGKEIARLRGHFDGENFRRPSGEPMYAFCRGFHETKYKSLIKCWPDDQKSEWISGDFLARVAEFDRRLVEEMEGYEKCLSR